MRYEIIEEIETIEEVQKFNPYHDARGRFSNANASASFTYAPGKSKAHDLAIEREKKRQAAASGKKPKVDEDANPAYRYHATSYKAAQSIQNQGLKPSQHAVYGKGVYFAPSVEGTTEWVEPSPKTVVLRVKHKTLKADYGYDEFPEQGWTENKKVDAEVIQIKTTEGEWVPLQSAHFDRGEIYW